MGSITGQIRRGESIPAMYRRKQNINLEGYFLKAQATEPFLLLFNHYF